ncbi:MAG: hypothetical protein ABW034_00220 [Steroidobacteraceae bacterium]
MDGTLWDPALKLPVPPIHTVYNETVGFWTTIVYALFALPVIVYALRRSRDSVGRTMLLILVGGSLCSLIEPFADLLGGCWHPEVNQPTVFELLGRGIPVWVCVGYVTYFGALGAVSYALYTYGITRKVIWMTFLSSVVIDILMENIMLSHGLYFYYGNQPLNDIGLLPLWWPPVNALGVELGAAAVCFLMPHLKGWRVLLVPLVMPIADLASYGLIAYPGMVAVNSAHFGPLVTDLLGLGTWVLAAFMVYILSLLIAVDSPLRTGARLILTTMRQQGEPATPVLTAATTARASAASQ